MNRIKLSQETGVYPDRSWHELQSYCKWENKVDYKHGTASMEGSEITFECVRDNVQIQLTLNSWKFVTRQCSI